MYSRQTLVRDARVHRLVPVKSSLPTRELLVVDHPQKHHGAACRAMLQLLEQTFTLRAVPSRARKASD